ERRFNERCTVRRERIGSKPRCVIKRDRSPLDLQEWTKMRNTAQEILRWLGRTPVQTFVLCPLAVVAFELPLHRGEIIFGPWGWGLLGWGYLQYLLVGNYRQPRAGRGRGMEAPPDRIITTGPYRYTRNPMYLGHLIFMAGLALTFWSWFALIVLA